MIRLTFAVRCVLFSLLALGQSGAQAAVDFPLPAGFTQNPSPPWRFGWKPRSASGAVLTLYPRVSTSPEGLTVWSAENGANLTYNGTSSTITVPGAGEWYEGALSLRPGLQGQLSVLRFTAPLTGSYRVSAYFEALADVTTPVLVLRNGTALMQDTVGPDRYANYWVPSIALNAGDQLEVAAGGSSGGGNVGIFVEIQYQPELDPSFGSGLVSTDVFRPNPLFEADRFSHAAGAVLQRGNKTVVIGSASLSPWDPDQQSIPGDIVLARYTRNGALDPTFGRGGLQSAGLGTPDRRFSIYAAAAQPDGKLLAAGTAWTTGQNGEGVSRFALARFKANGTLDRQFGSGGLVITPFPDGASFAEIHALVVQPNRRIVAVGWASDASGDMSALALARYLPDGRLDAGFGQNGRVVTRVQQKDSANAAALLRDGSLLVAGQASPGDYRETRWLLARYRPDGSLDPRFGSGGILLPPLEAGSAAYSLLVRREGTVLAGGQRGRGDAVVMQLSADGRLDASFGEGGIATIEVGDEYPLRGAVTALALQREGGILAGGWLEAESYGSGFMLARLLGDGRRDPAFADDGVSFIRHDRTWSGISTLLVQTDGKVIAAGTTENDLGSLELFALARYRKP